LKNRDFAQLAKQLLPDLPGFGLKVPLMYIQPVEHTLRGICFESHSYDAKLFYVWVFFLPLFVPTKHVIFNLGQRVRGRGGERWDSDSPNLISDLRQAIKQEALPFLGGLRSARDVAIAAQSLGRSQDLYVQQAIAYALAYARETDRAVKALEKLVSAADISVPWQREIAERAKDLRVSLSTNPFEALSKLEAWKSDSICALKLH
jgi:hypothetical protein